MEGPASTPPEQQSLTALLSLIYRVFGGYLVLFGCAVLILRRPAWELSLLDGVFAFALGLLLLLNRPHIAAGFPRFAALHLGAGLLVWSGANSVQLIP